MSDKVDTQLLHDALLKLMDILDDLPVEPGQPNAIYEWASEFIDDPVRRMICERDGHRIVDDQCMMPAHRFCLVCEDIMPDEPVREEPW